MAAIDRLPRATLPDRAEPGHAPSASVGEAAGRRWRVPTWVRAATLALLPLAALVELGLGAWQRRHVPRASDWGAAASAALAARKPGEAIIIAPRWTAENGRMALAGFRTPLAGAPVGEDADARIAGRSDLDVFPRVLELSIRGKDDPQTKGWPLVEQRRFGDVALRILQNPRPERLVRDLADELDPSAKVSRVDPAGVAEPCRWEEGGVQKMPGLFGGPEVPPRRWVCSPWDAQWTFVAPTVMTDLDFVPRRCILMHPINDTTTTVELPPRPVGKHVVAYVGLHVFQERDLDKAPVGARVTVGGVRVAETLHRDGEGWKRFEGTTGALAGSAQPVKIESWAEGGVSAFRLMCVAVQLRD